MEVEILLYSYTEWEGSIWLMRAHIPLGRSFTFLPPTKQGTIITTMVFSMSDALDGQDSIMMNEDQRLLSYEHWPINEGLCIPSNLAKAGFYYCSPKRGGDCVRCFCCYKELDNWELEDDPWKEHQKRNCLYAKLGTEQSKLTVAQMLQILEERQTNRLLKIKELLLESQNSNLELLKIKKRDD